MKSALTVRGLRRRVILPVLGLCAGVIGATAVTGLLPPVYEATSSVLISSPGVPATKGQPAVRPDVDLVQVVAPTIARLVETDEVAAGISKNLRLPRDLVAAGLTAQFEPGEQIISLTATAPAPETAANIADAATVVLADEVEQLAIGAPNIELSQLDRGDPTAPPIWPRPALTAALGGLVGLLLGLALMALRDRMDDRLRDCEAVGRATGLPVFGVLSRLPRSARRRGRTRRVSGANAAGLDALVATLSVLLGGFAERRLLVTGVATDEGHGVVATFTADALQQHGVDAALITITGSDVAAAIGPVPVNGTEIIVGPALLAGPTLSKLTGHLDAVVLVVRGGRTRAAQAAAAAELARRLDVAVVGLVVLDMPAANEVWPTGDAAPPPPVTTQIVITDERSDRSAIVLDTDRVRS